MTHILIGTPCYNGLVTAEYLLSMLGLQRELIRQGVEFEVDTPTTVSLIPVARNYLAGEVLRNRRFTHLLFIDADLRFRAFAGALGCSRRTRTSWPASIRSST